MSAGKGFYGMFLNGFLSGTCLLAGLDRIGAGEVLFGGFLISCSIVIAVLAYRETHQ